jgi:hypothetical protein
VRAVSYSRPAFGSGVLHDTSSGEVSARLKRRPERNGTPASRAAGMNARRGHRRRDVERRASSVERADDGRGDITINIERWLLLDRQVGDGRLLDGCGRAGRRVDSLGW